MKKLISISILVIFILTSCSAPATVFDTRPSSWSQKADVEGLSNLYKVDEHLYRSEQPHSMEIKKLSDFGIKTILNLRNTRNDNRESKATNLNLNLNHVPINTWRISYDDLVRSMIIIRKAEKPVLVHCLHGSDRTGAVVAVYRIVDGGWTKEEAIKELQQGGYGYHQKWFPNIIELIASLDVEKFKADVEKGL